MSLVKRALFIGINYFGTNAALRGCINDSENLFNFLNSNGIVDLKTTVFMNDKKLKHDHLYPTKKNIMKQLADIVKEALLCKSQMQVFIAYSGHGSRMRDRTNEENDGYDETLCPVDYSTRGFISDDVLKCMFIDMLPSNVTCFILIDACHSGSMLDLKYSYNSNKLVIDKNNGNTKCKVVMVSGCQDRQTSADAYLMDPLEMTPEFQGAMTASFMATYKKGISYHDLLNGMTSWLISHKFSQRPQCSSGLPLNVNLSTYLDIMANNN